MSWSIWSIFFLFQFKTEWSSDKLAKVSNKHIVLLGLIITVSFFIIVLSFKRAVNGFISDFFYPIYSSAGQTNKLIHNQELLLWSKSDLADEIAELRNNIQSLETELAVMDSAAAQNDKLRKLLKLPPFPLYSQITAQIIIRDPVFWNQKFRVNRGTDSGVKIGCPVIATFKNGTALVGIVNKVSKKSSIVKTILSRDTKVSVSIPDKNAHGILSEFIREKGKLKSIVEYLPAERGYSKGDEFISSGYSNYFPRGIKVGTLEYSEGIDRLYSRAVMRPYIDFETLSFVVILTETEDL